MRASFARRQSRSRASDAPSAQSVRELNHQMDREPSPADAKPVTVDPRDVLAHAARSTSDSDASASDADDGATSDPIDYDEPLLAQLARLGDAYDAWVTRARLGATSTRLFRNPALEALSKTHWSVVPVFWVPVIAYVLYCGCVKVIEDGRSAAFASAVFVASARGAWPTFEYVIHRFVFHAKRRRERRWAIWNQLHYLFHGCHHKHPQELLRLVFPLTVSVPVGYAAARACSAVFASGYAEFAAAGFQFGYLTYDMTHYAVHGNLFGLGDHALKRRRVKHLRHHYDDHTSGFGVTSSALDAVCGTLPRTH